MAIVKRREIDATYYDSYGEVTNEGGSLDLFNNPGNVSYIEVVGGNVSITKAASGGSGELILQGTDGTVYRRYNADGVKDVEIGRFRVGPDSGLQAVIANAGVEQCEASVNITGHISLR